MISPGRDPRLMALCRVDPFVRGSMELHPDDTEAAIEAAVALSRHAAELREAAFQVAIRRPPSPIVMTGPTLVEFESRLRLSGYAAAREDAARVCDEDAARLHRITHGNADGAFWMKQAAALIRSMPDERPATAGEEKTTP